MTENINLEGKILTSKKIEICDYTNTKVGAAENSNVDCTSFFTFSTTKFDSYPKEDNNDKISTNGKCGNEDGKCPNSQCGSKYGYCGTTEKYCGTGCQSEFGQCGNVSTTVPISTNGKYGTTDGKCPDGQCCSKYGYCGTSNKHCGTGCQSEFGQCGNISTTVPISTNDKCGTTDGRCPSGSCCSRYGYCGTNEQYCSSGCQSKFGKCN